MNFPTLSHDPHYFDRFYAEASNDPQKLLTLAENTRKYAHLLTGLINSEIYHCKISFVVPGDKMAKTVHLSFNHKELPNEFLTFLHTFSERCCMEAALLEVKLEEQAQKS